MALRVIQCATGSVGLESMRAILGRSDMKLVGLRVFSPDKVGQDAGLLAGSEATGLAATADFDEVLRTPADCVIYNALGDTHDLRAAVVEITALLRSGKCVVDTAISPPICLDAAVAAELASACEAGGTAYLAVGLNPGFMLDVWPVAMARTMARVDLVESRRSRTWARTDPSR